MKEFKHIDDLFRRQKAKSFVLRAEEADKRKSRLKAIELWVENHLEEINEALYRDFKKPAAEVSISEVYPVLSEIRHCLRYLDEWMHSQKVKTPGVLMGTSANILFEPKGACLIIAPWNYPFNLAIGPLISAIAAGNAVILKPSEISDHTSALIENMISTLFPEDEVAVVTGGPEIGKHLTSLPFDHIFFTGSTKVGSAIMKSAAENLTSVTLELGGKSPAIVDRSADIPAAAERIAWGKLLNNGQTCIAPDYVLVCNEVYDSFISELILKMEKLYGGGSDDFAASPDYARIINDDHHKRLTKYIEGATKDSARILYGGDSNAAKRYIQPTIIDSLPEDNALLTEEIFGPILPLIPFEEIDEAISFINRRPKPLASYVFARDERIYDLMCRDTSSGGICWNTFLIHFEHPNLPFGGVNHSGIGKSHGFYVFRAFSNERARLVEHTGIALKAILRPYSKVVKNITQYL
ncbi:MAG: aldehyde dehydrogenase family protein, partial [Cyclobacteriaceae bacterium]